LPATPSNPSITNFYLIRIEPFATLHIELQDQSFDNPSRLFTSIGGTLDRIRRSPHSIRELIPEFFFSSEFLVNSNGFNLGSLSGQQVNDVLLPPWSKRPVDFIHVNSLALESDYVSEHLNGWIDLIWGSKQRGEEAIKSDNTYNPLLYADVWKTPSKTKDYQTDIIESFLSSFGQIPQQLFTTPHLVRVVDHSSSSASISPQNIGHTNLGFQISDTIFDENIEDIPKLMSDISEKNDGPISEKTNSSLNINISENTPEKLKTNDRKTSPKSKTSRRRAKNLRGCNKRNEKNERNNRSI